MVSTARNNRQSTKAYGCCCLHLRRLSREVVPQELRNRDAATTSGLMFACGVVILLCEWRKPAPARQLRNYLVRKRTCPEHDRNMLFWSSLNRDFVPRSVLRVVSVGFPPASTSHSPFSRTHSHLHGVTVDDLNRVFLHPHYAVVLTGLLARRNRRAPVTPPTCFGEEEPTVLVDRVARKGHVAPRRKDHIVPHAHHTRFTEAGKQRVPRPPRSRYGAPCRESPRCTHPYSSHESVQCVETWSSHLPSTSSMTSPRASYMCVRS